LYVTFAEPEGDLRKNARASGFDVSGIRIVDLSPDADVFARGEVYDLFSASEVEREPTTARIVEAIEAHKPRRVFVDSMTSLRFLTNDAFQFRRQALSFLRYLSGSGATVVVTSESTAATPDDELRFIVDGVIELEMTARHWSLNVSKFRGSSFRKGRHGLTLGNDGAHLFPRLLPERFDAHGVSGSFPTQIPALDTMLGGGIENGTVTLVSGPTGVGKTTFGMQILSNVARSGRRAALFTFDERADTVRRRCEQLGLPISELIASGKLMLRAIEPLRFGPDEFASIVREEVEEHGTSAVMIDSVSGYKMTIEGHDLVERIHALGRYLQNVGACTFLIDELPDIATFRATGIGISYLADNVIFLRYVERYVEGTYELGRGVGILKKRLSDFDKGVRAFSITSHGIEIGERLRTTSLFAMAPSVTDAPAEG
jgi:circadian clock protein KaiC